MRSLIKRLLRRGGADQNFSVRAFRTARTWSNRELARFASAFSGKVVNVSAWEDRDKDGRRYRDYFTGATGYYTTNFGTDQGVLQGDENEIFLDLESELPPELRRGFDVVFNHTTLEHVYEFRRAFANMCDMASDAVVIVVPWLQPLHSNYGDFWRFSPQAIARLFRENGLQTVHVSWNDSPRSSVYVFAIAVRDPAKWKSTFGDPIDVNAADFLTLPQNFPGQHAF